jgi:uncharacterized protein
MTTWGLEPKHLEILNQLLFMPLKKHGARVWVFGSRARGDHKKFSDLDVLFEESQPLPMSALSKIKEDLEESVLPIKVDLVDLQHLAESYRPNVLHERIAV